MITPQRFDALHKFATDSPYPAAIEVGSRLKDMIAVTAVRGFAIVTFALLVGACVSEPGSTRLAAVTAPGGALVERDAAPHYGPQEPAAELAGSGQYAALIAHYAAENGVPLPLAHAVVEKESGYNAKATGRGTVGLMQIKPATARGIGYDGPTDALYEPATNLQWGMKYLGGAYKLGGGDTCGTALRYQGGHRATKETAMTRRYCAELKAIMARNGA
jgi:soluble lytic murein transglycosylase-like protein